MANGHCGGGWCAVFVGNESNRGESGRGAPGWVCSRVQTPLKSPLVQGGTLFSSNVAPQRGMKNSLEDRLRCLRVHRRRKVEDGDKTVRPHVHGDIIFQSALCPAVEIISTAGALLRATPESSAARR